MRFLFLNQYFPPDPAPTGVLLRELADRLAKEGHEVDFVDAQQTYRVGQGRGGRMRREMTALLRMLGAGFARQRPDVVISATSPPCLGFSAALIASRHRARHVHWVMDLYPEIAVALGEVREGALAALIGKIMGWSYRRADRVIVLDEDMAERLKRHGVQSEIIRPWVFASVLEERDRTLSDAAGGENSGGEPWTWIYSGNLGRAHEWETLLQAQAIVEERDSEIQLLFQGGGPAWPAARERAEALGLRRCAWRGYVEEEDLPASLLRSQACAATQRPEAQGLLWPSKLGLLLSLPRPILWIGPPQGAIADLLREMPQAGVFAPAEPEKIAAWLLKLRHAGAEAPAVKTIDPREHREQSLRRWVELLQTPAGAFEG